MTPSDLAITAAMPFEAKKDSMRQTQSGTWKVTFTVQATDVPRRLTEAMPGTRYQVVIVEIGADELPVQPAKEVMPNTPSQHKSVDARPGSENPPARAKRDWRDVPPTEQAGIRCGEPEFAAFLREEMPDDWCEATGDPAECVRLICGVASRKDLGREGNQRHRVIWHSLDEKFLTWKALERAS